MGGMELKSSSIERSGHTVSRERIFEMKFDGEGG